MSENPSETLAGFGSCVAPQSCVGATWPFSAPEHTLQIQQTRQSWLDMFRHIHPEADGTTHETRWPWGAVLRRHRLDYLFLGGDEPNWRVVEAKHVDGGSRPHSDHKPVLVRLNPTGISSSPRAQSHRDFANTQQMRGSISPLSSSTTRWEPI